MTTAGTVLLTGANGFIASHILKGLVERNYHVVATVRSETKGQELLSIHPTWKDNTTFVAVPDMVAEDAYDDAFKLAQFDYIIHTASPVDFTVTDIEGQMIKPAIGGTTNLLATAHRRGGPTLKRFVILGSVAAILNQFDNTTAGGAPYTEANWNPVTSEYAISNKDTVSGYAVSKTLAERAAWQFMSDHKPSFDLTILNPVGVTGPIENYVPKPSSVNGSTMFFVWNFVNGTYDDIEKVVFPIFHLVDVRDVALAHILAMTTPAASGQRIILSSDLITPQLVANIIRKRFPELRDKIVEGNPDQLLPPGINPTPYDARKSNEIFGDGWGYTSVEESIVDTVKSLLELEKNRW